MQLDLGNNIRQLRRRDKRTQEQLAEKLWVSHPRLYPAGSLVEAIRT